MSACLDKIKISKAPRLPQLIINMNNIQVVEKNSFMPGKLFFGSPAGTNYVWKNIVIEKSISMNWAYKLYKGSIVDAFWSVFVSPTN